MISDELVLRRHKQGIELVQPNKNDKDNQALSVQELMHLPVNLYFMNHESDFQKLNDITAESCGFISSQDAYGKSLRDVSKLDSIAAIRRNDIEIIQSHTSRVSTETYTRQDDLPLTALSIKFPWYQANRVVGVFGCSILLGYEQAPSLADALALLMPTGLLAQNTQPVKALSMCVWEHDDQYFDQRDKEILYWLVRGKTAKDIAKRLGLSYRTIEHRLDTIKEKLSVTSKSELIDRVFDKFIVINNPAK